jgi:hypothetical protein
LIESIAEKATPDLQLKINISDVPHEAEIKRVQEIGIKQIKLGIDGYLAHIDQLIYKTTFFDLVFKAIFASPDSAENIKKRANTHGQLILKRSKFESEEIKKDEWLTNVGKTIIESDADNYTITLEDGTKISTSNLKVSKNVQIKKHANSLAYNDVKASLLEYYRDLEGLKILDC